MTAPFSPTRAFHGALPAGRPLRVGFLSPHNPFDRRAFSGTAFFAARALAGLPGIDLRVLGPHRPPTLAGRLTRRLRRQPPPMLTDPDAVDAGGVDAVVGLVATGLLTGVGVPYLHVTDATPAFLRAHYGWTLPPGIDAAEARVAARSAAVVYSSDYMARRAARDLGQAGATRIRSVPFGVNFQDLPVAPPRKPPADPLRLLFVTTDWERKGGDLALGCLERLVADGTDARLTVVGHLPDAVGRRPGVFPAGFLDKNNPRDVARLAAHYRAAHLLLLPTRGDCTPMVVAEALAHGTPVIATDTGGVAMLMDGGRAGRLLPPTARAGDWAMAARALTADPMRYAACSAAGFDHARRRLTWSAWARGIGTLLEGAVGRGTLVA